MPEISKIIKRNQKIVDFKSEKITLAIKKAFLSLNKFADQETLEKLTAQILEELEKTFTEKSPAVEDVQDIVEKILTKENMFDIAKSYILYRHEHSKLREKKQKTIYEKIEKNKLTIRKQNGKEELFNSNKLEKSLQFSMQDLQTQIDAERIMEHCLFSLYENITTEEIAKTLILSTRSFIEKDPAYETLTANLLLDRIYKEVLTKKPDFQNLKNELKNAFINNIKTGVNCGKLDKKLLEFNLEFISENLKFERDKNLKYLGLQTLYDRYLIKSDETNKLLETPQFFWMRVAMGLSLNENNKNEKAVEFYNTISKLDFVPSTPTLFHAGTTHPQLSSCYLSKIEDSLEHIFKTISDNAQLSKWSGGIGNDWSAIRATGAFIKGTGVNSQGIIPFLKIANDTTVAINRSGRRRGATCAYLETWHYDIEDFLELRKNTGDERRRTHDMNTANWIPDLFMKRVIKDTDWTLFSPDETPELHELYGKAFEKKYIQYEKMAENGEIKLFKKIKAQNLWRKMITMLFETGHPWITFKDPANIRSPQDHVGVIHHSNLCTEITLNTSPEETAVCNLGSINLKNHISEGRLDSEKLKNTIKTAIRMLDNVIDINFYPTKEAQNSNMRNRPIGLGIMGFQDALYLKNINFDSHLAIEFADISQELISFYAISASNELAKERGAYATFKGSKWDRGIMPLDTLDLLEQERGEKIDIPRTSALDWENLKKDIKQHGMRNSNCLAIAPTATISNITGCFPGIEPIYKNLYVKSNMSGEFTIINPYLVEDLKKIHLWNEEIIEEIKAYDGSITQINNIPQNLKNKYKEAFEIDPKTLIQIAAYRGKWIDQSQSLNMFVKGTSGKTISEIYIYAWKMGLKTTYYLRTLAATGIEKSTLEITKQQETLSQKQKSGTDTPWRVPANTDPKLCRIENPECEVCQ